MDLLSHYMSFILEYTPVSEATRADDTRYDFDFIGALMNFFFYSLCAPRPELTSAPWLSFPDYFGFFDPSPLSYFSGPAPVLFLACYLALFAFIRASRVTRLVLGLGAFVLLRFVLVLLFNPVEAILYASVAVLPLLFVLFHFLEASAFRHKTALVATLAASMLVANGQFFFGGG